ncbi:MAG: hypothetical protein K0Q68_1531 [Moraxellaceae bacterium]|jgi:hypothetical protein|nr:hypothetical protein [Moraxellaceae bacterium]
MNSCPYTAHHLKYFYGDSLSPEERPFRPQLDDGLFHHDDINATLDVINEVANQLGLSSLYWCHFMEDALRHELQLVHAREDILCGLHRLVAQRQAQARPAVGGVAWREARK